VAEELVRQAGATNLHQWDLIMMEKGYQWHASGISNWPHSFPNWRYVTLVVIL